MANDIGLAAQVELTSHHCLSLHGYRMAAVPPGVMSVFKEERNGGGGRVKPAGPVKFYHKVKPFSEACCLLSLSEYFHLGLGLSQLPLPTLAAKKAKTAGNRIVTSELTSHISFPGTGTLLLEIKLESHYQKKNEELCNSLPLLCNKPLPNLAAKNKSFICLQFCGLAVWAGLIWTVLLMLPRVLLGTACSQLSLQMGLDGLKWSNSLVWPLVGCCLGDLVLLHVPSPVGQLRLNHMMASGFQENESRSCKAS